MEGSRCRGGSRSDRSPLVMLLKDASSSKIVVRLWREVEEGSSPTATATSRGVKVGLTSGL